MERTVETKRGPVRWSFDIPSGYKVMERAVPTLGYPWEVAGAGNWDFPPSCPANEQEEELFGNQPRLDIMPPGGVFMWLLMGDLAVDYEVTPRSDPPFLAHEYMVPRNVSLNGGSEEPQPVGASRVSTVSPITEADRVESKYAGVAAWSRLVLLTDEDGVARAEPEYLYVRAFAGSDRFSISTLNESFGSLSYIYTA